MVGTHLPIYIRPCMYTHTYPGLATLSRKSCNFEPEVLCVCPEMEHWLQDKTNSVYTNRSLFFQLPPPHFHWGHPNTSPNCCTKFSSNTGMLEACQGYQHIGPCPASPCTSSPKDLLEALAVLPSTWPLQSPK